MASGLGTRLLIAGAIVQVGIGLFGVMLGTAEAAVFPPWVGGLILTCFVSGAGLLLVGGRADRRAIYLGVVFLLVAVAYAERFLQGLSTVLPAAWSQAVGFLAAIELRDFLPLFLAHFARAFPEIPLSRRSRRTVDLVIRLFALMGGIFLAASLWARVAPGPFVLTLLRWEKTGAYLVLGVLPLLFALWKTRRASGIERRRARVFLAALLLGFGPIFLQILLEGLSPAYHTFSHRPGVEPVLQVLLFSLLGLVPFTTAYAVLVHRVLDVRLIARRALQYALARHTTRLLALVPFGALCLFLVRHRHQTLAQLFSGSRLAVLLAATVVALLALRYRRPVLDAVDRRFFREQYDARQLLTQLVEQIRSSPHAAALADLVAHGVDRALHLETIAVLVAEPETGLLADPEGKVRALDPSSALASLVAAASEPLEVDLEAPRTPVRRLPEEERHWVADGGFQLLMPLPARDGRLVAVIALGGKKSGLPFLREDRQLLAAIATSAALALELHQLRRRGPEEEATPAVAELPSTAAARECLACGRLFLPAFTVCGRCQHGLEPASVPFVVPGKFRFECRLGAGGMGVVYLAVDLALGRPVAVKTLRRLSPEDAMRLRREARTAATVFHPHLAVVFGVETWRGTPMLILEYLEGGTLSERLARAPLDPMETVELGIAMAGALERLHAAEILHRDVKPSNIGYARDGTPKLMDFGIARAHFDPRGETGGSSGGDGCYSLQPTLIWGQESVHSPSSRRLVGTLFYLPPEAFDGAVPGPPFDLWSLCLVLYECLSARRVFEGDDIRGVIRAIRHAGVPEVYRYRPDCPQAVAAFLDRNLSRQASRRAPSAGRLRSELEEVRRQLLA